MSTNESVNRKKEIVLEILKKVIGVVLIIVGLGIFGHTIPLTDIVVTSIVASELLKAIITLICILLLVPLGLILVLAGVILVFDKLFED